MSSAPHEPADDPVRPVPDALEHRELLIRRAPKASVFLIGGALLGAVVALVVTLVGPENPEFTPGSIFGYFLVVFGVIGVGVGALIWLVLDRRSKKRAYPVRARVVADPADADYAVNPSALQQWGQTWENERRDDDAR